MCKLYHKNILEVGKDKENAKWLKVFKSISAIKAAQLMDLEQVLPKNAALAVYQHFHDSKEEGG